MFLGHLNVFMSTTRGREEEREKETAKDRDKDRDRDLHAHRQLTRCGEQVRETYREEFTTGRKAPGVERERGRERERERET